MAKLYYTNKLANKFVSGAPDANLLYNLPEPNKFVDNVFQQVGQLVRIVEFGHNYFKNSVKLRAG
jgi:hypothetical protein